ncbi:MAG: sigma-70 family RNA polymerase sigma factor [Gemmataceae bacterium]|nr:sigma-70 family RNA polymerase sigma factor [Gemmataceae bacterium]
MPFFKSQEFTNLLQQSRSGSTEALGKILERLHGNIVSLSKSIVAPELLEKIDRNELVQETLAATVAHFASFQGHSEAQFLVWLRVLMRNRALNMVRRDTKTKKRSGIRPISLYVEFPEGNLADLIPDDQATPFTALNRRERRQLILAVLKSLKEEHRTVLELRCLQSRSFDDIAAQLGKSTAAVAKTYQRALRAWRDALIERGLLDES